MSASTTSLQRESTFRLASGAIAAWTSSSDAPRVSSSRTIRHSIGIRTLNRSQHVVAREQRHERAAVALALEQALVAEGLDRGAHRRAGDAELAREVGLRQRRAGLDRAVEDLLAQRDDDGFGGRDRGDGETGHQAAISVPCRRRRTRAPGRGPRTPRHAPRLASHVRPSSRRTRAPSRVAGQLRYPPAQRRAPVQRAFPVASRELVDDGLDGSSSSPPYGRT